MIVAGVGLLGAVVGAKLNKKREHEHWLRDQRLRVSVDFITATRRLLNEYRRHGEAGMDQVDDGERHVTGSALGPAPELFQRTVTAVDFRGKGAALEAGPSH